MTTLPLSRVSFICRDELVHSKIVNVTESLFAVNYMVIYGGSMVPENGRNCCFTGTIPKQVIWKSASKATLI